MKLLELTVTRVGNSRGVHLPAEVLRRYFNDDTIVLEQREVEIALRPKPTPTKKLAWKETYEQMAQSNENWTDWEGISP
jgi:antitoxin component of MazEF toxin-antitoxin module